MRPARIAAVVRREIVRSGAGRRGLGFAVVALVLLLPAGALRLPAAGDDARPAVSGEVPAALEGAVRVAPKAATRLQGADPLVVETRSLRPALREALTALEARPAVRLQLTERPPLSLPDRTLLVALLAISLLTGPLAETLPGEREGRTLEVLLSTSLSRGELVVGKWLAWTGLASLGALASAAGGVLTGALDPGPWLLAMPLALGVAVALGLWLVRGAADLVGGAAAPMRVLPVVAVGTAGLAWSLGSTSPLLAAAVPMGGALLVAGGLLPGVAPVLAAALGSGLATAGFLLATTRSLDQQGVKPVDRGGGAWGPLVGVGLAFWLAVAGPAVFALGGNQELLAPASASFATGGLVLALGAAVALAREGRAPDWGGLGGLPRGAVLGLALACSSVGLLSLGGPDWAVPFRVRLEAALVPAFAGLPAALLLAAGQELFFRGWLQRRLGLWGAALAWVVLVMPMDPVRGLGIGLALGLLVQRHGLLAALLAHGLWFALAGRLSLGGPLWADLLLVALGVLLAALPAGGRRLSAAAAAP